jgi:hypothetical protein
VTDHKARADFAKGFEILTLPEGTQYEIEQTNCRWGITVRDMPDERYQAFLNFDRDHTKTVEVNGATACIPPGTFSDEMRVTRHKQTQRLCFSFYYNLRFEKPGEGANSAEEIRALRDALSAVLGISLRLPEPYEMAKGDAA